MKNVWPAPTIEVEGETVSLNAYYLGFEGVKMNLFYNGGKDMQTLIQGDVIIDAKQPRVPHETLPEWDVEIHAPTLALDFQFAEYVALRQVMNAMHRPPLTVTASK